MALGYLCPWDHGKVSIPVLVTVFLLHDMLEFSSVGLLHGLVPVHGVGVCYSLVGHRIVILLHLPLADR